MEKMDVVRKISEGANGKVLVAFRKQEGFFKIRNDENRESFMLQLSESKHYSREVRFVSDNQMNILNVI